MRAHWATHHAPEEVQATFHRPQHGVRYVFTPPLELTPGSWVTIRGETADLTRSRWWYMRWVQARAIVRSVRMAWWRQKDRLRLWWWERGQ